jgi:hypothetical protein
MCRTGKALLLGLALLGAALLEPAAALSAEHRVALVIGNASYQMVPPLKNPIRDARLIADRLQKIGFETLYFTDVDGKQMRRAFRAYSEKLAAYGRDTIGLIFFAGHGIQVRENNYLLPTDADIRKESDAGLEAVHLADVLNAIFEAANKLNVVVLDACRDNPYRKAMRTAGTGLAGFEAPVGTLVSFSTGPGKVASDGETNSPFAVALAAALQDPGLKIEDAFKRVSEQVYATTSREQLPWYTTSVHGDFFLARKETAEVASAPRPGPETNTPPTARTPPRTADPPGGATIAKEEAKPKAAPPAATRPGQEQAAARVPPHSDLDGRIAFFIEWKFFGSDNGARRLGPESYAETLDYYGKRAVPRDQVLKDKNKYYERWPNRRFALHRDTLQITERGPGTYDVRFDFKFDVENETRQSVGSSTMSLGLRRAGNDFVILSQDETVRERKITDKVPGKREP